MVKRAIIFDFFGVICNDEYGIWLRHHGFKRHGQFTQMSCQADLGKIDMPQFFDWLASQSGQTPIEVQNEFLSVAAIHQDVVNLADQLHRHYKIGLLSNAHASWINQLISQHNLARLFDQIMISSELKLIKPEPEIFESALERLEVSAAETVFIDDKPANTQGAEALGISSHQYQSFAGLRDFLQAQDIKLN